MIFRAIYAGLTDDFTLSVCFITKQLSCDTHSYPCEELWGVWQNHQLLEASGKQTQVWSCKYRNTVGHMNMVITVQDSHLLDCTVTYLSVSNISFITNTGPLRGQQATAGLKTKHFLFDRQKTDWAVTWFIILLCALSLIINSEEY